MSPSNCFNYFTISYRKEGVRQYDLRADTEEECFMWVDAINNASFSKLLELKQQAEQKQLHLLQILETEQRAKWHYVKQIEELTAEIKQLKYEVQSFFRGWLCRRRWKQIVEEYIRSDHAESMRKRNSIVFGLVECEDEYVQQLSILVTCYLRPFRMAASSKKPIVTHEDVNSIFLNAEAVLFLHQVFVQGLRNKMENWPTLQLGTLIQVMCDKLRSSRSRLGNFGSSYKERKEAVRQVFLFTNHLLITARTNNGKLRLVKVNQLNVNNEQKSQQDSVSFMTKSNIVQLLNPTPMNVINNSETNTRSSVTTTGTITTTHELSQSQLHKRYTCPDSTLNRYTTVNKSNSSQMDPMYKSTTTTISCLPTLTVQHRHSTSLCISSTNEQDVGNDTFKSTNIPVPCFNTNTTIPANLTTVNTNNVSVLHSRNSSNVSYSLTPIITPDINIMSSSTLSTQPTSPSFSMLHRFSNFRLIWEPKNGQPTSIWLVASTLQEKAAWCSDISQLQDLKSLYGERNLSISSHKMIKVPLSNRMIPELNDVDYLSMTIITSGELDDVLNVYRL
ncbi:Ras-specific guanine nucleotide-releasing factor 2, partial [Schistosoma japonicum]